MVGAGAAIRSVSRRDVYAAARAAQHIYVRSVGLEAAPYNVQVNATARTFVENPTYFPMEYQATEEFRQRSCRCLLAGSPPGAKPLVSCSRLPVRKATSYLGRYSTRKPGRGALPSDALFKKQLVAPFRDRLKQGDELFSFEAQAIFEATIGIQFYALNNPTLFEIFQSIRENLLTNPTDCRSQGAEAERV